MVAYRFSKPRPGGGELKAKTEPVPRGNSGVDLENWYNTKI